MPLGAEPGGDVVRARILSRAPGSQERAAVPLAEFGQSPCFIDTFKYAHIQERYKHAHVYSGSQTSLSKNNSSPRVP